MPRDLEPVTVTLTPKLAVGELRFTFDDAGHPVQMVADIVKLIPQPNGQTVRELVAPVIFRVEEFSQWPEFPATYTRISEKVWERFDADEAQRAEAMVAAALT